MSGYRHKPRPWETRVEAERQDMDDQLARTRKAQEAHVLRKRAAIYAAVAAEFRDTYLDLGGARNGASEVTAAFIGALVAEREKARRLGAVRVKIGGLVERDRTLAGRTDMAGEVVHSGKELVGEVSALDVEGVVTGDSSNATAESSDPSKINARIEIDQTTNRPVVVMADAQGGNTDDLSAPETWAVVTVRVGDAVPAVFSLPVVPGDAVTVVVGGLTERDRTPPPA